MITTLLACVLATSTPQVSYLTAKQDIYLSRLAQCESGGKENIKILDSNNQFSYSVYQFQMQTWKEQSAKYGLNYTEADIYDYAKQKYLAHLMLKDGGERNWYNCTTPLGKYPN